MRELLSGRWAWLLWVDSVEKVGFSRLPAYRLLKMSFCAQLREI